MKAWLDKAWISAALGIFAGAVIVLCFDAIGSRKSSSLAPSLSERPETVARVVGPAERAAPRANMPSEAAELTAEPPAGAVERSPLPASLQMALDHDPGSRVAQFHAQMAREARDSGWAMGTEYQLQVALHDAAPKLLGRLQLLTTCASSMCEMVGVINGSNPEQASRDTKEWRLVLQRMPASSAWGAVDLGSPVGSVFAPSTEGGRAFIVEFPRKRLAAR